MQEKERDARQFRERIEQLPCMWTHIRLRAVLGRVNEDWVLLGLHGDLICEEPQTILDLSDVSIPETVKLVEDIRPFSDLDGILTGIENGEIVLSEIPVTLTSFRGSRTIFVRGHYEDHLIPSDVSARWTDCWPSIVLSIGGSSLEAIGFDEKAVDRELASGDYDHQALYELTRDAIGFQLGGAVMPHIYMVAPVYLTLSSGISTQKIAVAVKCHKVTVPSDICVRITELGESQRFRRSIPAKAMDSEAYGIWKNHTQNIKRPEGVTSIVMRLIYRDEHIDRNFQSLGKATEPSYFVGLWQNVKFADSLLGIVELRYPTWGDTSWIAQQLDEKDARTFTCRVLAHQIIRPNVDVDMLCGLDNERLSSFAQFFISGVDTFSDEFKRRKGRSYFDDFQHFFKNRLQSVRERTADIQRLMQSMASNQVSQIARAISEGPLRQIVESVRLQQEQIQKLFLPASQLALLGESAKTALSQLASIQESLRPAVIPSYYLSPRILPQQIAVFSEEKAEELQEDLLDELLNNIDPNLTNIRKGAWQTLLSDSPDALRQAFHSMRELVREVFEQIAPDGQVQAAPWYRKPDNGAPVTRKQRVRFALSGNTEDYSQSNMQTLIDFWQIIDDGVDRIYAQLSSIAHGKRTQTAEAYLRIAENLLILVLSNRKTVKGTT